MDRLRTPGRPLPATGLQDTSDYVLYQGIFLVNHTRPFTAGLNGRSFRGEMFYIVCFGKFVNHDCSRDNIYIRPDRRSCPLGEEAQRVETV